MAYRGAALAAGREASWRGRGTTACLALGLAVLALELFLRGDPLSARLLEFLGVDGRVQGAPELHRAVMDYLLARSASLPAAFSPREAAHFADVRGLLAALRLAGVAGMTGALLLTATVSARAVFLGRALGCAGRALLALLVWLGLCVLEWRLFFTAFHPLLFPGGGYSFNPHVDLIVNLYPSAYFAAMGAGLAASLGLAAGAALVAGAWLARRAPLVSDGPARRAGGACFVLCGLGAGLVPAPAFYLAGQRTLTQVSPGFLAYGAVCAGLLAGAWLAVTAPRRSWPRGVGAALLAASLACYAGLDIGLRASLIEGREAMIRGDAVIAAAGTWRARTGHWPKSLGELVPGSLPELPPCYPGSAWGWSVQGECFTLTFSGPLAYSYQYDSARSRWKHP